MEETLAFLSAFIKLHYQLYIPEQYQEGIAVLIISVSVASLKYVRSK